MSKAFTKEDSDAPEPKSVRRGIPVPAPNYVTADGLDALRAEHARLAATAPRDAAADARLHELADHLATAELPPPIQDPQRVGFGATVTLDSDARYTLVGALEADPKQHAISWQSPIARALDDAAVGDRIALPRGEVTVVAIAYARSR